MYFVNFIHTQNVCLFRFKFIEKQHKEILKTENFWKYIIFPLKFKYLPLDVCLHELFWSSKLFSFHWRFRQIYVLSCLSVGNFFHFLQLWPCSLSQHRNAFPHNEAHKEYNLSEYIHAWCLFLIWAHLKNRKKLMTKRNYTVPG